MTLPLSECFGPTIQGEGPATGALCSFVRLGLCNLSCSWCDTPYTWDTTRFDVKAECPDTPIPDIHDQLREHGTRLVVLSGGEPLLHHQRLMPLLTPEWRWHAETNGTIPPPSWWPYRVEHTSVSPKVATDDPLGKRIKPDVLEQWAVLAARGSACFKFVVRDETDIKTVTSLCDDLSIEARHVWIMPEGTAPDVVMTRHRELADAILAAGYNTSTRLHVLLWGNERGH